MQVFKNLPQANRVEPMDPFGRLVGALWEASLLTKLQTLSAKNFCGHVPERPLREQRTARFFSLPGKILINTSFDVGYPLDAPLEVSCSGGSPQ